jgi:hypothetical protein
MRGSVAEGYGMDMGKIESIEKLLAELTPEEYAQFLGRIYAREFEDDDWDRQMKADAAGGKFDEMSARALRDHRDGKTRPL